MCFRACLLVFSYGICNYFVSTLVRNENMHVFVFVVEILLTICCLYLRRWMPVTIPRCTGITGFSIPLFCAVFWWMYFVVNFATSFVFLPNFCCFSRLFPCHPFSAFCCVGWHVECPCFTAAFYFPVYFFVFLLSKYNLHGLYTPCSHSNTPLAPLWSPWSDLPPSCFF